MKKDYWFQVTLIGWGKYTTDYNQVSKDIREMLTENEVQQLRTFVVERQAELYDAIEKWEKSHSRLDIGSDDGLNDVTAHIVGLGETEFKKCINDPTLIEKRYNAPYGSLTGYKESFLYCFHKPE
jgi:hypothetical protein